jgi:hypothetical protein
MDIFNLDDQRTILDVLRRSDFSDAAKSFAMLIEAAHSRGKLEGSQEIGRHLLEKLDSHLDSLSNPEPEPVQIDELEADMRQAVISKFRHRGEEEGAA